MEPRGCNRGNQWQNRSARNPPKQAKSVAAGHRLPEKFYGKQGVCRGLQPVAELADQGLARA